MSTFPGLAVVVTPGKTYIHGWSPHDPTNRLLDPPIDGHSPTDVLTRVARLCAQRQLREATVVLDDLGARATWSLTPMPEAAKRIGVPGELQPWSGWAVPTGAGRDVIVNVCFAESADPDRSRLIYPAAGARMTAFRLAWYQRHLGAAYKMTAGVSGVAAMRELYKHGKAEQPFWGVRGRRPIADPRRASGDITWASPHQAAIFAADGNFVHGFDLNRARLAAANVATLPWSQLVHHPQGEMFDSKRAGYWLVHTADLPARGRELPPVYQYHRALPGDLQWLTSPVMEWYQHRGQLPEAIESYTAPGKRWLYAWSNSIEGARLCAAGQGCNRGCPPWAGDALLVDTVKRTYKEGVGMIDREGGSVFLPQVAATIYDRQRVTVLTHIERIQGATGKVPLAVATDCVWYAADTDDSTQVAQELGITIGNGLGQWKVYGSITRDEWKGGKTK